MTHTHTLLVALLLASTMMPAGAAEDPQDIDAWMFEYENEDDRSRQEIRMGLTQGEIQESKDCLPHAITGAIILCGYARASHNNGGNWGAGASLQAGTTIRYRGLLESNAFSTRSCNWERDGPTCSTGLWRYSDPPAMVYGQARGCAWSAVETPLGETGIEHGCVFAWAASWA